MRSIFIMAQGAGSRWYAQHERKKTGLALPIYKQCLPIGGETLIARTIRLLAKHVGERDHVYLVSTNDLRDEAGVGVWLTSGKAKVLKQWTLRGGGPLLTGIADCMDQSPWSSEIVFLLGDVLFSRRALEVAIGAYGGSIRRMRFTARLEPSSVSGKAAPELFSLAVQGDGIDEVRKMIGILTKRGNQMPGKLWNLWDMAMTPPTWPINDYTDDVDSPEEYLAFWPAMRDAALAEETT